MVQLSIHPSCMMLRVFTQCQCNRLLLLTCIGASATFYPTLGIPACPYTSLLYTLSKHSTRFLTLHAQACCTLTPGDSSVHASPYYWQNVNFHSYSVCIIIIFCFCCVYLLFSCSSNALHQTCQITIPYLVAVD